MNLRSIGVLLTVISLVTGCGSGEVESPSAPVTKAGGEAKPQKPVRPAEWPRADDPVLISGRAVWLENCENCHGIGKAESPRFMDYEAWAPRLAKGEAELINSAINGFEEKTEAGMPPRGGNDELTDEQVTAAAKYMIHFSTKP